MKRRRSNGTERSRIPTDMCRRPATVVQRCFNGGAPLSVTASARPAGACMGRYPRRQSNLCASLYEQPEEPDKLATPFQRIRTVERPPIAKWSVSRIGSC